ncbi:L-threonylcarbamoyladenylate synthase [Marinigracilibium pacificum]|uniref:Threonylcarbamoyl-AMP synthase n=1 Tax=Marinigracilibium pacificum TaxID=2729599 RepID=A0A848J072_9BACT|nr:L-threonylcarbamoyladenylate synthase [Marinigracilibium pacificum]NMM49051.1 threonylcarbamoyl-AMP synthase [Marinigracilibium pacificum]
MSKTVIGTDIKEAASILQKGGLVAVPTETVYGLAANATDPKAVTGIFEAKQRPSFDPLIVHTDSLEKVRSFTKSIPESALKLANQFWPGPLTLILEKKDLIPDIVSSGLPTIGVRMPDHPLTRELLSILDFPIAAPSANPFGYISPTNAEHVKAQLDDKVDYILDGGECKVGIESTIVSFENDVPVILRLGGLSIDDIEKVVGKVKIQPHSSSNPKAPGMLKSHYAPRKKFYLGDIDSLLEKFPGDNIGVLTFTKKNINRPHHYILSPEGDTNEAAANLFSFMRKLDNSPIEAIIAEKVPEVGLGKAINDRLSRAAADT